jgi:multiple antibiotic resistance protein
MDAFLHAVVIAFSAMFPMINPVGHAPMFYAMTTGWSEADRRKAAWKSSLYATLILIAALLVGRLILEFFAIDLDDLRIAGGILVAHSAWGMITNKSRITPAEHEAATEREDISLTPLAIPILSGPGAISLAMGLLSYGDPAIVHGGYAVGFILIGLLTWVCFLASGSIVRLLGVNGTGALNRILGLFIMAIGVNLVATGVHNKLSTLVPP